MKLFWIYLIVLSWTLKKTTALNPYPQDDEGEETTPAPEGGDATTESPGSSPGDGETTTPAAEGETTADVS